VWPFVLCKHRRETAPDGQARTQARTASHAQPTPLVATLPGKNLLENETKITPACRLARYVL
jgi:hypothetical protein